MIPYGRQDVTETDIEAVVEVLKSDFLTQGPLVPAFEQAVANKVGTQYGVAVNSATSALHIACKALGLGPGDILWTTPISFVASANCGLYCGAMVDFVDIDPVSYNLCPQALEKKLKQAEQDGNLPKILVAVHLCGQSCDMLAIRALTDKYEVKVIEDASHAIGGKYQGRYIGDGRHSDITVFSFHPVKIITTAEGGIAVTNSIKLASKMRLLSSHGITREEQLMSEPSHGPWYYQQIDLGYNYRMTELQAALGVSQIPRLDEYVLKRNRLANQYDELLSDLPIILPQQCEDTYSARHLYIIRLRLDQINQSQRQVFEQLRGKGIGVNLHYIPIHMQPYFQQFGFQLGDYPEAESYYQEALSLPLYPGLTDAQLRQVVSNLREVFEA